MTEQVFYDEPDPVVVEEEDDAGPADEADDEVIVSGALEDEDVDE